MTSRDFCYWLQGYFEIAGAGHFTIDQTVVVKRHLALVFKHEIDPSYGGDPVELQAIHDGPPPRVPNPFNSLRPEQTYRC